MKQLNRTAAVAWGQSAGQSPMLATGTLSGAFDASFSTNAELEVFDVSALGPVAGASESARRGHVEAPGRFNSLTWGTDASSTGGGLIVGGLEDGTVCFWNASALTGGSDVGNGAFSLSSSPPSLSSSNALVNRSQSHQGNVRGLQFNKFQPNLLASGANDGEVLLWDTNSLDHPYSPGAGKSAKLVDVTDLAWNTQVQHILASSSSNGFTVIWDLKNRREVMSLASPNRGTGISSIAWNPDNATQILTASDDDGCPVIFSWDLRNAHAPEKVLKGGHTKGILSIAWCPKDSELLLSCGKDCKTVCWNPANGTVISETVTQSNNWIFDVQWCPKAPDMFCTASFDGSVQVYSYQALASGVGGGLLASQGMGSVTGGNDPFGLNPQRPSQQAPQHLMQPQDQRAKQIPKWLRRPIGASFGFGGRLVVFSSKTSSTQSTTTTTPITVSILTIVTIASAPIVEGAMALDGTMRSGQFGEFCQSKIRRPIRGILDADREAVFWSVMRVLVESNPQERLLNLIGFDGSFSGSPQLEQQQQLVDRVKVMGLDKKSSPASMSPPPGFGGRTDSISAPPPPPFSASTEPTKSTADAADFFERYSPGGTTLLDSGMFGVMPVVPASIPTSPLAGNQTIEGSDGSGDQEQQSQPREHRKRSFSLFPKPEEVSASTDPKKHRLDRQITQSIILGRYQAAVDMCLSNHRVSDALLIAACGGPELVASTQQRYFEQFSQSPYLRIVAGIIKGDLEDVVENADLDNWTEILGLICFHDRTPVAFARHCHTLGERLLARAGSNDGLLFAGLLCLAAAGASARAIGVLLQMERAPEKQNYYVYAGWLEGIVEKIRILERTCKQDVWGPEASLSSPALNLIYLEYAYVLSNQGFLQVAGCYYNSVSPASIQDIFAEDGSSASLVFATWRDRLASALRGLGGDAVQIDPSIRAPFANTFPPVLPEGSAPPPSTEQPPSVVPQRQPSIRGGGSSYLQEPASSQSMRAVSPGGGIVMPPPPPPILASNQQQQHSMMPPMPQMPPMQSMPNAQPTAQFPPPPPPMGGPPPQQFQGSAGQFGGAATPNIPPPPLPNLYQPPAPQHQTPYYSAPTPPPTANLSGSMMPPPPPLGLSSSALPPPPPPPPSSMPSFPQSSQQQQPYPNPLTPPPPSAMSMQPQQQQPSQYPPIPKPQTPPASAIVSGANPPVFPPPPASAMVPPPPPMTIPPPPMPSFMDNPSKSGAAGSVSPLATSASFFGSGGPMPSYNDPPMVPPKAATAAAVPFPPPPMMGQFVPPQQQQQQMPQLPPQQSSTSPSAAAAATSRPSISSPGAAVAPVDPATIPPHLQPIYQTLSGLIGLCQSRAMPMQKRIVDDSTKRIQHLFHQLARQELSPVVLDQVNAMCSAISQRNYDAAHELHLPLMTNHYNEVGQWILAVKRLIDLAKTY